MSAQVRSNAKHSLGINESPRSVIKLANHMKRTATLKRLTNDIASNLSSWFPGSNGVFLSRYLNSSFECLFRGRMVSAQCRSAPLLRRFICHDSNMNHRNHDLRWDVHWQGVFDSYYSRISFFMYFSSPWPFL